MRSMSSQEERNPATRYVRRGSIHSKAFLPLSNIILSDSPSNLVLEKTCEVCDLPYATRKEIEGMILGGWIPEDLEHWIALRFRLKVSASAIQHHYEWCYLHPPVGRELIEVAEPEAGLVFYCLFTRKREGKDPT